MRRPTCPHGTGCSGEGARDACEEHGARPQAARGLDGYHAALAIDGNPDGSGDGARTTSWVSDNWELTHELAVIFPHAVLPERVRLHWPQFGTHLVLAWAELSVLREGGWEALGGTGWWRRPTTLSPWTSTITPTTAWRCSTTSSSARGGLLQRTAP
ncbi:MAG: hypothetical protein AB7Y46_11650 [Armatimonadota bacterium]